ncbi:arylsulfotransferase family protein [Streptomyces sp. B6B3]|uniref:arylsulfotransferase family protein n=1 Tax=Streptomyces sp. B6B3 TaxID=3153570 RepID=UPI00325EFD31
MRRTRLSFSARSFPRGAVVLGTVALAVPLAVPAGAAGQPAAERSVVPLPAADVPIEAPVLTTTPTGQEDSDLLLTSPQVGSMRGMAVYENSGELVYWQEGPYQNLSQVTYQGEPALSVYRFTESGGECLLLDSSYTEIASFSVAGTPTDGHDCQYSPDGSRVLLIGFRQHTYDLSEYGGLPDATLIEPVVQERDLDTGEITFEWSGLDHVPVDETQRPLTDEVVDYMHVNSLAYDTDGNLLVSARTTSTVYKIDIDTGEVLWRFGGKASDFAFADPADAPSHQHDARRLPDGRLTVFDNGNHREPLVSRGAAYELDEQAMTAELVEDLRPSEGAFVPFAGSNREVADGNQLVSFGDTGEIIEFGGPSGTEPVFTATFPEDPVTLSYRAERATDWEGTPAEPPTTDWSAPDADGGRELTMSWNGATEVDRWLVEAGSSAHCLDVLGSVSRSGYATAAEVRVPEDAGFFRVSALDARGRVLGSSTGSL